MRVALADSPGTPDESRLMHGGVHCGKQVIRDWNVAHGLEVPVQRLSEAWTGERTWNAPGLQAATQAVRRLTSQ